MIGAVIAVLKAYQLVVVIRAVQSWLPVDNRQPWVRFLAAITDPVLTPLRAFARFGNLDLSPVLAIVVIELIIRFVARA